jgi:hypothetical protein
MKKAELFSFLSITIHSSATGLEGWIIILSQSFVKVGAGYSQVNFFHLMAVSKKPISVSLICLFPQAN